MSLAMPCEDCEQGQSTCCRLIHARDIEAVIPDECWVTRSTVRCAAFIGTEIGYNRTVWTEEMCCLPCRIRLVIERTAKIP